MLIRLNVAIAVFRHDSYLRENPVLEVVGATAFTAGISYLVSLVFTSATKKGSHPSVDSVLEVNSQVLSFLGVCLPLGDRVQSSELVANLFQDCDISKGDYHGLCKCVYTLFFT